MGNLRLQRGVSVWDRDAAAYPHAPLKSLWETGAAEGVSHLHLTPKDKVTPPPTPPHTPGQFAMCPGSSQEEGWTHRPQDKQQPLLSAALAD